MSDVKNSKLAFFRGLIKSFSFNFGKPLLVEKVEVVPLKLVKPVSTSTAKKGAATQFFY